MVGAPFALITASVRRGMDVIGLWHCWGDMEAQVYWVAPECTLDDGAGRHIKVGWHVSLRPPPI